LFDLVPKDFNFFRRRLESLIEAHGTKRIVAIAHQDCAWYREHTLFRIKVDLRERQIHDLKRVAARLHETFPKLTIETYFARLEGKDPERVVFEPV
jgi:hypothetical protein